jgi:hypothetical protein
MEMISYHRKLNLEFPIESIHYEDKLYNISESLLIWLKEFGYNEMKTGLYLGTSNAGVFESISFWKDALIQSPRFANPANFNWTLSNGPASFLSRTLQIKGPCYTLIGGSQAIEGCFYHASEDLKTGTVLIAIVSGLDIYDKVLHFSACLLSTMPGTNLPDMQSIRSSKSPDKLSYSSLIRILDQQP